MCHCTGIFIMSMEHILHKINSFWNFYYIINFLRNTYYRGTSVPSHICTILKFRAGIQKLRNLIFGDLFSFLRSVTFFSKIEYDTKCPYS
jgi:hypothetical protein